MKIKVTGSDAEKQQAFDVRTKVFVDEQNVPPEEELDAFDEDQMTIHFIGHENDQLIAASRLRFVDTYGKLERICVLKEHRGNAHGTQLIGAMEARIQREGLTKSKLNAQTHAVDFYKRLGYEVVSGEFLDAGIPHVTMVKELN
ncbi:GNAT family N-acetyltransferase [Virgibacillus siamensis]|uniref:GNAT family N-acetyltransferase n=1 Tax=Virgibacillus siamensis TaxID=480071 RepID=UPI00098429F1|nr:GNAT family N-acetyltransferase [Virgibacillus siamensis]